MAEEDKALDEMFSLAQDIKSQAKVMNLAISESNLRLSDLGDDLDVASTRIKKDTQLCVKYKWAW